jgi:hypothetical protein
MVDEALPQAAQESVRVLDGKPNQEFAQADPHYFRIATKIASSRVVGVHDAQVISIDYDGAGWRGSHESADAIAGPCQSSVRSVAGGRNVQLLLLSGQWMLQATSERTLVPNQGYCPDASEPTQSTSKTTGTAVAGVGRRIARLEGSDSDDEYVSRESR